MKCTRCYSVLHMILQWYVFKKRQKHQKCRYESKFVTEQIVTCHIGNQLGLKPAKMALLAFCQNMQLHIDMQHTVWCDFCKLLKSSKQISHTEHHIRMVMRLTACLGIPSTENISEYDHGSIHSSTLP